MFLKELKEVVLAEKEDVEQPAEQWTDKNRQKFQEIREHTIELKKAKVNTAERVGFLLNHHLKDDSSEREKVLHAQLYLICLIRVCEEPEVFEDDKVKKGWETLSKEIYSGDQKLNQVLRCTTELIELQDPYKCKSKLTELMNAAEQLAASGKKGLENWYTYRYATNDSQSVSLMDEFSNQIFEFLFMISAENRGDDSILGAVMSSNPCVSAVIAEKFYRDERYEEAIPYAERGVFVKTPPARQNAFIILGLCCEISGKEYWQEAYDAYDSWLSCKMTGNMKKLEKQNGPLVFLGENEWRESTEGKMKVGIVLNNYAYLCVRIADEIRQSPEKSGCFRRYALEALEKALKLNPGEVNLIYNYGLLLAVCEEYLEAIEYWKLYFLLAEEKNRENSLAPEIVRLYCNTVLDLVLSKLRGRVKCEDRSVFEPEKFKRVMNTEEIQEHFEEYFEKLEDYRELRETQAPDNVKGPVRDREDVFCAFHNKLVLPINEEEIKVIEKILLLIYAAVTNIVRRLRVTAYSEVEIDTRKPQDQNTAEKGKEKQETIAYYTTLDTVRYLFDELYQPDVQKAPVGSGDQETYGAGKNCLTMMHAMYMNDPNEGLTLLQALKEQIDDDDTGYKDYLFGGKSPEEFRESIYDRYYIFLKAFTSRVDKLDMWAMYASDRTSGSDSNGCCICLNPETFARAQDMQKEMKGKKQAELRNIFNDDLNLYRIVYLDSQKEIRKEQNPEIPDVVCDYYNILRELVGLINTYTGEMFRKKKLYADSVLEIIREFLGPIMEKAAFLFKEESYFLEQEMRLLITRTHDQRQMIRQLHTNPPKLCVNPFFQVYVDQMILGPKVGEVDQWIPYFQYELNEMRKKDDFPKQTVVRKSKIHYRD